MTTVHSIFIENASSLWRPLKILRYDKSRLDSNIESKSSNNTYLNIIKFFFQFEDHRIRKFSNNIDFRKLGFLSEEEKSERSRFVNKDIMQSCIRAYQPYTLVGPPVRGLVLALVAVYSLTTVYICHQIPI